MPKVPFTAFFNGPLAVYPIQTGQSDPVTGAAYLGTEFIEGNYADVSNEDVQQWNRSYGTQLLGGRYRICRVALNANTAGFPSASGLGEPVGWAPGTNVKSVVIGVAGTGYTNGTFNIASTYNIGSQAPAIATVIVSGGVIVSASLVQGGGPFLATPTFSLSELTGGTGASILAQLAQSSSFITSFDSTAIAATSLVKGICYTPLTAAQIAAGAWVVVQESGIAQVQIGTANGTTPGSQVVAVSGGTANTAATPAYSALEIGFTLATAHAGVTVPTKLTIPLVED